MALASPAQSPVLMQHASSNCVNKAFEIPVVQSISTQVLRLYSSAKEFNRLSQTGFSIVETTVEIVARNVGPVKKHVNIERIDSFACSFLDSVTNKYPLVKEPTDKVVEAGRQAVLTTAVGRYTLDSLDKILLIAEVAMKNVPEVQVATVTSEQNGKVDATDPQTTDAIDDSSLVAKTIGQFKYYYAKATVPLHNTVRLIGRQRVILHDYQQMADASVLEQRRLATPKKSLDPGPMLSTFLYNTKQFLFSLLGHMARHSDKIDFYVSPNADPLPLMEVDKRTREDSAHDTTSGTDEAVELQEEIDYLAGNKELEGYASNEDSDYQQVSQHTIDSEEYKSDSLVEELDSSFVDPMTSSTKTELGNEVTEDLETAEEDITPKVEERIVEPIANGDATFEPDHEEEQKLEKFTKSKSGRKRKSKSKMATHEEDLQEY